MAPEIAHNERPSHPAYTHTCRNATYSGSLLMAAQSKPALVERLEKAFAEFLADASVKR